MDRQRQRGRDIDKTKRLASYIHKEIAHDSGVAIYSKTKKSSPTAAMSPTPPSFSTQSDDHFTHDDGHPHHDHGHVHRDASQYSCSSPSTYSPAYSPYSPPKRSQADSHDYPAAPQTPDTCSHTSARNRPSRDPPSYERKSRVPSGPSDP